MDPATRLDDLHGEGNLRPPEVTERRINKPARMRFKYRFPPTATARHGFLTRAFPDGVPAETTACPYLILTPLIGGHEGQFYFHGKRRILTHKQSGARVCGPLKRGRLLEIAAAINGIGIDWSQGHEAIRRYARTLPQVLQHWLRAIQDLGSDEFDSEFTSCNSPDSR